MTHAPSLESSPFPADLERLLKLESATLVLPEALRIEWIDKLERLKHQIEQMTCSASWFDHCWKKGGVYPPPADTTPMRPCHCERCRLTGKLWPACYTAPRRFGDIDGFISYECHLESLSDVQAAQLPSSRSGIAMRAIRAGRIKRTRLRTRPSPFGKRGHSDEGVLASEKISENFEKLRKSAQSAAL